MLIPPSDIRNITVSISQIESDTCSGQRPIALKKDEVSSAGAMGYLVQKLTDRELSAIEMIEGEAISAWWESKESEKRKAEDKTDKQR